MLHLDQESHTPTTIFSTENLQRYTSPPGHNTIITILITSTSFMTLINWRTTIQEFLFQASFAIATRLIRINIAIWKLDLGILQTVTGDPVTFALALTSNSKLRIGSGNPIAEDRFFDEGKIIGKREILVFANDGDGIFIGFGKTPELTPVAVLDRWLESID